MKKWMIQGFLCMMLVALSVLCTYWATQMACTQQLHTHEIMYHTQITRLQTQITRLIQQCPQQEERSGTQHTYPHATYDPEWDGRSIPGQTLAKELQKLGITPETIISLKFIGDESSGTSGIEVLEQDKETITWIWDWMLRPAEPYSFWVPSGNRRVEIYLQDETLPATILLVNETDATSAEGLPGQFMCHGLHDVVLSYLEKK